MTCTHRLYRFHFSHNLAFADGRAHGGSITLRFFDDSGKPASLDDWLRARQIKRESQLIVPVVNNVELRSPCNPQSWMGGVHVDVDHMRVALVSNGRRHTCSAHVSSSRPPSCDTVLLLSDWTLHVSNALSIGADSSLFPEHCNERVDGMLLNVNVGKPAKNRTKTIHKKTGSNIYPETRISSIYFLISAVSVARSSKYKEFI